MTIKDYNYYVDIRKGITGILDENEQEDDVGCYFVDITKSEIHHDGNEIVDKKLTVFTTLDENDAEKIKRIMERTLKTYIKLSERKEYIGK